MRHNHRRVSANSFPAQAPAYMQAHAHARARVQARTGTRTRTGMLAVVYYVRHKRGSDLHDNITTN